MRYYIACSIEENGISNIPILEDALKGIVTYGSQQLEPTGKHWQKIMRYYI